MSHKTVYRTFSDPDLNGLETQVNDFIKSIHKNEHHTDIKVRDITTLNVQGSFIAAVTYSFMKKKLPDTGDQPDTAAAEDNQL